MSDKRIRELVRSLLLDMTPAQVLEHVARELNLDAIHADQNLSDALAASRSETADGRDNARFLELIGLVNERIRTREPRFPLAASLGVTEDEVVRALEVARQEGRQWLSEP